MPFTKAFLWQALTVAAGTDLMLIVLMPRILEWHTRLVAALLKLSGVPWESGGSITLLPGISTVLLRTVYLDYAAHPLYPTYFTAAAVACFLFGYRFWPAPLKPLLFMLPASLGITLFFLRVVWPAAPYTPEEFGGIWYRGEVYLWLLLPFIFGMSFLVLNIPFALKIQWLVLLLGYSIVWSAVRLAVALATFHYFGSIWMPFFYFAFGFLADFLYIVTFYSLAMDRAAVFLARRKEIWQ